MNEDKINILYAEDDELKGRLIKIALEQANFSVTVAPDGEKAWQAYKERKPDIILLDLDMPEKNGLEVIQMIREEDKQIHIVVYTSHGDPDTETAALDNGADGFISKEQPIEVLVSHLNSILRRIKNTDTSRKYALTRHTTYNCVTRELSIDGQITRLKGTEGRLLHLLCAKYHEVANKSYLVQGTWNKSYLNKEKELKKYICLLRKKLKADSTLQIESKDGGYILLALFE